MVSRLFIDAGIAEEQKADKEQGEDLAPHDLAKDLTVIGPMGDSSEWNGSGDYKCWN